MSPDIVPPRRVDHADGQDGRASDELRQLRATVVALRDELERARIASEARLQKAVNAAHEETQALRQMIQALRDELDTSVQRFRQERTRLDGDWRGQLMEAQRTIVELRRQLDHQREPTRP